MEECYKVYLTPTGFGAVFLAILSLVEPDDEILVTDSVTLQPVSLPKIT